MFRAAYRDPALPILALTATLKAVSACRCHGWRRNAWRRHRAGLHRQFHMVHVLLMRRGGFGGRGEPPHIQLAKACFCGLDQVRFNSEAVSSSSIARDEQHHLPPQRSKLKRPCAQPFMQDLESQEGYAISLYGGPEEPCGGACHLAVPAMTVAGATRMGKGSRGVFMTALVL